MTSPTTAQTERTVRAREALRAHAFHIEPDGADAWTVKNGDRQPYTVRCMEGNWSCTCPDFGQRGPAVRCKHIEAVRLSLAGPSGNPILPEQHKEQTMSNPNEGPTERVLQELRRPLDMARVKRRQAPGQGTVPFLEGYDVIQRANDIFSFAWSFDLLKEPVLMRWQKTQTYYSQQHRRKMPILDEQGHPVTEEVGIVWITGKVTVELDGKPVSHADVGRCTFTGDTPEALDMALAGAATDCLKRCFRQFGEQFGLSLYDKEVAQSAGLENSVRAPARPNGHGHGPSGSGRAISEPTPVSRVAEPRPAPATPVKITVAEAGKVIFSLRPKTRPELTGKTLAELQRLAPDVLAWLANEYNPTPETQAMKEAAQALVAAKAREAQLLAELGFAN